MTDEQHLIEDLRSLAERDQSPGNRLRNALRKSANHIEAQAKELAVNHRHRNDAQVQELVEALRFYAREVTYRSMAKYTFGLCSETPIEVDGGKCAKSALAAWEGQQ